MLEHDILIEERLLQLEKISGVQFAVVTIDNLGDESIEGYAEGLFQAWGIGKKGEDNGLLLLISKEDRKMRIEVGYGLEPYIPDAFAGHIIDSILKVRFGQGEFDLGVVECIYAVAQKLQVDLGQAPQVKVNKEDEFSYIELIFIILVLIIFSFTNRRRGIYNRGPRVGPRLPPFGGGSSGGRGGFGGGRSGGGGASGGW